jgi:hypothetical protein
MRTVRLFQLELADCPPRPLAIEAEVYIHIVRGLFLPCLRRSPLDLLLHLRFPDYRGFSEFYVA